MKMTALLVLVVVVLGLVWAVGWGPLKDASLTDLADVLPQRGRQAPAPVEQKAEEVVAAKRAPARSSRTAAGSPTVTETAVATPAEPLAPAQAPPPPKRFPTAADLEMGMRGSNIEALYGPPVARTLSVDQNGRIEVFIYRRDSPAAATFVHLRNGQVISASTSLY